ncbi:hypothetical protein KNJ79_11235 [Sphingopyxis indica]|uniref:hypothetical protein n=1 Tax=Sphingopyxis indica TaxID=436663 RepID=UPI002938FD70|nr:hypothetical protein [Sphingopyxis indica]WOF41826.1 hypothetical protein KNJ79_11235 [Sphingopyxis indica]
MADAQYPDVPCAPASPRHARRDRHAPCAGLFGWRRERPLPQDAAKTGPPPRP